VKDFWDVVTKCPKVWGSEKWGVKCCEELWSVVNWRVVKWSEVTILDEMCVLSPIHIYVAVCSFCAVCCPFITCFYLSFYMSVPAAGRSKEWVYGRSPAEIVGSNLTGGMAVCCECCVCCQVEVSARSWSLVQRSPTDCDESLCVI